MRRRCGGSSVRVDDDRRGEAGVQLRAIANQLRRRERAVRLDFDARVRLGGGLAEVELVRHRRRRGRERLDADRVRAGRDDAEERAVTNVAVCRAADRDAAAVIAPPPLSVTRYVQAGAFGARVNAEAMLARLNGAGINNALIREVTIAGRQWYRVQAGPVDQAAAVDALVERLRIAGIPDARPAHE